jgi:hypothetical protein
MRGIVGLLLLVAPLTGCAVTPTATESDAQRQARYVHPWSHDEARGTRIEAEYPGPEASRAEERRRDADPAKQARQIPIPFGTNAEKLADRREAASHDWDFTRNTPVATLAQDRDWQRAYDYYAGGGIPANEAEFRADRLVGIPDGESNHDFDWKYLHRHHAWPEGYFDRN